MLNVTTTSHQNSHGQFRRSVLDRDGQSAFRPARGLADLLELWAMRRRSRLALADLDDRLLNDIGLTPAEARRESAMGFWRP